MLWLSTKLGFFLAIRNLKRANKWTTALIVFVMTLTFINLIVVSGILIGLVEGSSISYRSQYSGDLIITTLPNKSYIEQSQEIIDIARTFPEVVAVSGRYLAGVAIEANYKEKISSKELPDRIGTTVAGITKNDEDAITKLSTRVIEGSFLDETEEGYIVIGTNLLQDYARLPPGFPSLRNVHIGDKVRVIMNGITREVTVKGFVKSKIGAVGQRVYMTARDLSKFSGRTDYNVGEIALKLKPGASPIVIQRALLANGAGEHGNVLTWEESQGQFFSDIASTFDILGNTIGGIALVVASITIFIVIYINAISKRKYIGILKGIGINGLAIEISYILQALFYSTIGTSIGLFIGYGILKPYVDLHPIDFPFSDGTLGMPVSSTVIKVGLIMLATFIAGYLPAKIVVRGKTLDAILGR